MMKKLKRRLSAAFRGNSNSQLNISTGPIISQPYRTWSLSDSMSQLADRLAVEGIIVEEENGVLRHPIGETR
ncbi:unnamed protein product, partial [Mesorhabditis spiculigera]